MSRDLVFFPSGQAWHLRDGCDICGVPEFAGEVVMAYDPESGGVYLICERCYRRRQDAEQQRRWKAARQQPTSPACRDAWIGCDCGD